MSSWLAYEKNLHSFCINISVFHKAAFTANLDTPFVHTSGIWNVATYTHYCTLLLTDSNKVMTTQQSINYSFLTKTIYYSLLISQYQLQTTNYKLCVTKVLPFQIIGHKGHNAKICRRLVWDNLQYSAQGQRPTSCHKGKHCSTVLSIV